MSVQPLVMVLLGGVGAFGGPAVGAVIYKLLDTVITRYTEYWQAVLGGILILLVTVFPRGLPGHARSAPVMSAAGMLAVEGLSKSFGGVRAVDDVSLVLPKGEIRALIGPNGAGKTTLFNMLTGQLRPDAGEVRWKGERLSGLPPYAVWRRGVSRTFQITATFSSLSALDNVRVARLSHARRTYALLARAVAARGGRRPRAARPGGARRPGGASRRRARLRRSEAPRAGGGARQ